MHSTLRTEYVIVNQKAKVLEVESRIVLLLDWLKGVYR